MGKELEYVNISPKKIYKSATSTWKDVQNY